MSRPARWECENPDCRRLLGTIEHGTLRLARAVEVVYAVAEVVGAPGLIVLCPRCDGPRIWRLVPPGTRAPDSLRDVRAGGCQDRATAR